MARFAFAVLLPAVVIAALIHFNAWKTLMPVAIIVALVARHIAKVDA